MDSDSILTVVSYHLVKKLSLTWCYTMQCLVSILRTSLKQASLVIWVYSCWFLRARMNWSIPSLPSLFLVSILQYLGVHGSLEPGGTAGEQLHPSSPWTCHSWDEQHLVQAVALRQAGKWAHLPATCKGYKTQNLAQVHQGKQDMWVVIPM